MATGKASALCTSAPCEVGTPRRTAAPGVETLEGPQDPARVRAEGVPEPQLEPEAVPVRDGSTMVSVVLAVCDFVGHQVINVGTALLVALAEAAWDSVTVALAAAVLLRVPHGEALRVTKPLDEALLKSDALACAVRLAETLLLLL